MILKLAFSSTDFEQKFLNETREGSITNVNISLINYAFNAAGLTEISTEGEAIEFLVYKNGIWEIELIDDPITRLRNGDIIEPANNKIKMLGLDSWSLADETWGQIRIANRYKPFNSQPVIDTVSNIRPVEVIVMDSGINKDHIEFENAIIEDLFKYDNFASYSDDIFHGTAVTSLIVGKTLGVYPNCKIKNVKFTGNGYKPSLIKLGEAFDAILAYHNTCPNIPKVLNMSWTMQKSLYIEYKLQTLYEAGILLVCAAGNTSMNIDETTPGSFIHSLTVAASDKNDNEFVPIYGINKKISFYAPGAEIKVALNTDIGGYTVYSGSSFSSAFASAVAAQHFSLGATPLSNSVVAQNIINDCTSYALTLNNNVSTIENKILHNLLAPTFSLANDQFLGSFDIDAIKELGLSFPISRFIDITSGTENQYSIIWEENSNYSIFSESFVDSEGIVNIKVDSSATLGPDELKTLIFKLRFETQGLIRESVMLYLIVYQNIEPSEGAITELLYSIQPNIVFLPVSKFK